MFLCKSLDELTVNISGERPCMRTTKVPELDGWESREPLLDGNKSVLQLPTPPIQLIELLQPGSFKFGTQQGVSPLGQVNI